MKLTRLVKEAALEEMKPRFNLVNWLRRTHPARRSRTSDGV